MNILCFIFLQYSSHFCVRKYSWKKRKKCFKRRLKELQNCIFRTILWSLFYSIRVYTSPHFLTTLLENIFFFFWLSALFVFCLFWIWRIFIDFCKTYVIIIYIVDVRYSVFLFSLTNFQLKAHSHVWDNFWQLKALWKWWKMLFISPQKLFSFSRYLSFCLDFLVMYRNGLIKKIKLISNFMTPKFCQQTIVYTHIAHYLERYRQSDNEIWSVNRM